MCLTVYNKVLTFHLFHSKELERTLILRCVFSLPERQGKGNTKASFWQQRKNNAWPIWIVLFIFTLHQYTSVFHGDKLKKGVHTWGKWGRITLDYIKILSKDYTRYK